jgi:hypothetical protein
VLFFDPRPKMRLPKFLNISFRSNCVCSRSTFSAFVLHFSSLRYVILAVLIALQAPRPTWLRLRFLPVCLILLFSAVPGTATTVVPPQFEELVAKADYIVRAVVKSVNTQMHTDGPHRHIITKVELDVREVISGIPPKPLILEMLGGKVGDEEMTVDGTPKFQIGDEDILFVRGNGVQFCPLVALLHGRYPIKSDASTGRRFMTRGDGSPLANEQEVARPMMLAEKNSPTPAPVPATSALTPSDFVIRIKTAVAKHDASIHPQP